MEAGFLPVLNEGPDKTTTLTEAVQRLIRPEMSLHFAFGHSRANAVAYEIVRQFLGKTADFTLVGAGVLEYGIILVWAGLVRKLISAFFGDTFPAPGPSPILQQAFREGKVDFECWTNLTISLGLMAGAFNVSCLTTNSLQGSSMAEEHTGAMKLVDDPFHAGKKLTLIKALQPDLAIVHGLAADKYGNTIIPPPYGENMWGAYASTGGVLVTVEEIIDTEAIRRYSPFVKIPGHLVRAVVPVPYGAHPQGMANFGLRDFEAYAEDYRFRLDFQKAAKDPRQFAAWMQAWVLDGGHEDYLDKLGPSRLAMLKGYAEPRFWQQRLKGLSRKVALGQVTFSPAEAMVAIAARILCNKVSSGEYPTMLAGIGTSHLASWLAKYQSAARGLHFDLLTETGFYGYFPRPGDSYIFNYANIPTSKMQSNFVEILGAMVGNPRSSCLGVLAVGQIDRYGNINSTKIPEKRTFIVGSGGANDVASSAREIVAITRHLPRRLVERVAYITSPGQRVKTLVTDLGVMEKCEDNEFVLVGCLTDPQGKSLSERIHEARQKCGWDLKVAPQVVEINPPAREELALLRQLDPDGYFIS